MCVLSEPKDDRTLTLLHEAVRSSLAVLNSLPPGRISPTIQRHPVRPPLNHNCNFYGHNFHVWHFCSNHFTFFIRYSESSKLCMETNSGSQNVCGSFYWLNSCTLVKQSVGPQEIFLVVSYCVCTSLRNCSHLHVIHYINCSSTHSWQADSPLHPTHVWTLNVAYKFKFIWLKFQLHLQRVGSRNIFVWLILIANSLDLIIIL